MEIETSEKKKGPEISVGLTTIEAEYLLQQWGRNELEEKKKSHVSLIDRLKPLLDSYPIFILLLLVSNHSGTATGAHAYNDLDSCDNRSCHFKLA